MAAATALRTAGVGCEIAFQNGTKNGLKYANRAGAAWAEAMVAGSTEHDHRLETLLGELNLRHLSKSLARSLSGGERRRLEITRALVVEPKLLFFDEPFAGVDPRSRSDIVSITKELKRRGVAVLITDHHAEAILGMVDRLYVMDSGTIMAEGTPQQIVDNADVRAVYLGDEFRL